MSGANYTIELEPGAKKQLAALEKKLRARIIAALEGLKTNPRPDGVKKLKGHADRWRVRVGDYRIIYSIDDKERVVLVHDVVDRKDAYD